MCTLLSLSLPYTELQSLDGTLASLRGDLQQWQAVRNDAINNLTDTRNNDADCSQCATLGVRTSLNNMLSDLEANDASPVRRYTLYFNSKLLHTGISLRVNILQMFEIVKI